MSSTSPSLLYPTLLLIQVILPIRFPDESPNRSRDRLLLYSTSVKQRVSSNETCLGQLGRPTVTQTSTRRYHTTTAFDTDFPPTDNPSFHPLPLHNLPPSPARLPRHQRQRPIRHSASITPNTRRECHHDVALNTEAHDTVSPIPPFITTEAMQAITTSPRLPPTFRLRSILLPSFPKISTCRSVSLEASSLDTSNRSS